MDKRENYYFKRAIPALLIIMLLFILPLIGILSKAFSDNALAIKQVFSDKYTYKLLLFTFEEAFLSALISTLLALPFAAFFASYTFKGRKAILSLSELSFTMPSILVVLGFVIWYGNNGLLNNFLKSVFSLSEPPFKILYSFKAIILAHVYLNFPIAFALLTSSWEKDSGIEENVSYTLGKSKVYTFFHVTLYKLKGTVLSAFTLIFLYCFSSFSIVLVLGGKPKFYTLEAEIYKRTYTTLDFASSSALSLFVLIVTSILLLLTSGGKRRAKANKGAKELIKTKGKKSLAALFISLLILLFILPPMLSILYRAFFTKDGVFTLKAWNDLASARHGQSSSAIEAIVTSLVIGLLTAFITTMLATDIALASRYKKAKIAEYISTLPMAAGSVTLGLGFVIVSTYLELEGIMLYVMVLLAHIVIAIPFAVRTIAPGARAIPDVLENSSYTLAKSYFKTECKVDIPALKNYRRKAFAFAFALSLGEVNATLTFSGGSIKTLPVLLYNMISSYNYQGAAALGTILLLESLLVFIFEERR